MTDINDKAEDIAVYCLLRLEFHQGRFIRYELAEQLFKAKTLRQFFQGNTLLCEHYLARMFNKIALPLRQKGLRPLIER